MTEATREIGVPEFRTWPIESFGQVLKVSGNLGPEIFPYRVLVPKDSNFFRRAFDGVYKGRDVTVYGSSRGDNPMARGVVVEHMAILAANDLGEIMISKEVFQGNSHTSLTKYSKEKMREYTQMTRYISLPPGWRKFGDIHSHPIEDALNAFTLTFARGPKVNNIGVTWSAGDFESLVNPIKNGYLKDTVLGLITPTQLGFMVASKKTIEVLKKNDPQIQRLIKTNFVIQLPPYKNFE
ncbi:hypothetical protein ACFL1Q_03420, partial [Patescibacteria group bacterium]